MFLNLILILILLSSRSKKSQSLITHRVKHGFHADEKPLLHGESWSLPRHPEPAGAQLYNCYLKRNRSNKNHPKPSLLHVTSPCNTDLPPTNRPPSPHACLKGVSAPGEWGAAGGPGPAVPGAGGSAAVPPLPAGSWPVAPCLAAPRNPFVSSFLFPRSPCACVRWEREIMSPHCHVKRFLGLPSASRPRCEKQYPCAAPPARSQMPQEGQVPSPSPHGLCLAGISLLPSLLSPDFLEDV